MGVSVISGEDTCSCSIGGDKSDSDAAVAFFVGSALRGDGGDFGDSDCGSVVIDPTPEPGTGCSSETLGVPLRGVGGLSAQGSLSMSVARRYDSRRECIDTFHLDVTS